MSRTVAEWIAKHDDEAIPMRVSLRVFEQTKGHCAKCSRRLRFGHWACDHIKALCNGGQHRESNLQALCISPCHSEKTAQDVAEKSTNYRKRVKHVGLATKRTKIQSAGFAKAPPQRTASRPIERHRP